MKQIIITMLLLAATIANAQDKGKTPQDAEKGEQQNEIFDDYFEPTAHFPGGDKAYLDYIKKNMRYPEEAKKKGIEGRVLVQCVIEKDGSHNSYKVIKSADSLLNEEAIRIVKGMPKWIPGNDWGETKRVRYTMPITFKLEKEQVEKEIKEKLANYILANQFLPCYYINGKIKSPSWTFPIRLE